MMDIIDIGATFDWITPVLTILQDIGHGGGHKFAIPADCGRSGRDIANLLKNRGVKSWGHMVVSGSILLTVEKKQVQWAQYILESAGIPVDGGAVSAEPSRDKQKSKSKQGYEPGKGWGLFG